MAPKAGITIVQDGVIKEGECYPIAAFQNLTGMGHGAMREARKKGLLVRRVGLRLFVLGRDFLDFVQQHGQPVE